MRADLFAPFLCVAAAVWLTALYCKPGLTTQKENKLILAWVPYFQNTSYRFGLGRNAFEAAGCDVTACEIVDDKHRFPLDKYDALLFHGFEYYSHLFGTPNYRSQEQLYVYMAMESEMHCTIPQTKENFYNLTMTYRLDSDIPWPYYTIVDRWSNEDVAPKLEPYWDDPFPPDKDSIEEKEIDDLVNGKRGVAAWVASNCNSDSGREQYVKELQRHGLEVDVFGRCGPLICKRTATEDCTFTIGKKYNFYLVFENSFCQDYVTEKMVTALGAGAVPVALNGVDLSKFLPPDSYLDARSFTPKELADEMNRIVASPKEYKKLLWWRARYRVERRDPGFVWPKGKHPFCKLCELLHKPETFKSGRRKVEVREWWHTMPDSDETACELDVAKVLGDWYSNL